MNSAGPANSVQLSPRCPLKERMRERILGGPGVARAPWRRRSVLPWIFAIVVAAGAMLPIRQWLHLPRWNDTSSQEFETIWRPAGNLDRHRAADVIRTIDGDTFEARVHLAPGQDVMTRVACAASMRRSSRRLAPRNCASRKRRPMHCVTCSGRAMSRSTISAQTNIKAASLPTLRPDRPAMFRLRWSAPATPAVTMAATAPAGAAALRHKTEQHLNV